VERKKIDLPPVPRIKTPIDGTILREGTPVVLDSEGSEDDGLGRYDNLIFSWFSNLSGLLGVGEKIQVYLDEIGIHRITLYVDDGSPGHNVSTSVNVTIEEVDSPYIDPSINETDDDDPLVAVLVISVISVILMALIFTVLILRYKKRKEEEIVLEYREKTEDDQIYEEMVEKEERELGIMDDPRVLSEDEIERERKSLYGEFNE
jgi:hypothetical protein